jgi:DNA replication protein DnaC
MKERFRLPMTKDDAVKVICAAVKVDVETRHRKFEMNDSLSWQIDTLAQWLTSENSKFGLLLCGGCGNGKTTLVRAFQRILNQANIRDEYNRDYYGIAIVEAKDIVTLRHENYRDWENLCKKEMLAIDDLGVEPVETQAYGNVFYPIVDMLTKRYDRQLFTIITTNLTPAEIREKYGERIADRLNEMMEKIIFKNDTYRK